MTDLTESYTSRRGPELFETSTIQSGDVRSLCQDAQQHSASFMETISLLKKKSQPN